MIPEHAAREIAAKSRYEAIDRRQVLRELRVTRHPCFAIQAKTDENQPDFPPESLLKDNKEAACQDQCLLIANRAFILPVHLFSIVNCR